jgi:2-iminobutanoate/2-iminopropanoate deaminase
MIAREVITGPDIPKPIGPYSQAVRGQGLLFVSGQPGTDPATGQPAGETFAEQVAQAFRNLEGVLHAAGSRPDLVVSTTVLVADAAFFPELNEAFAQFFPQDPPTRMTMQVPLPRGLLISIGAVAVAAEAEG